MELYLTNQTSPTPPLTLFLGKRHINDSCLPLMCHDACMFVSVPFTKEIAHLLNMV